MGGGRAERGLGREIGLAVMEGGELGVLVAGEDGFDEIGLS